MFGNRLFHAFQNGVQVIGSPCAVKVTAGRMKGHASFDGPRIRSRGKTEGKQYLQLIKRHLIGRVMG